MSIINIVKTAAFEKALKKLHPNQKSDLDKAVNTIMEDPNIGEAKNGDLINVIVYKFKMVNQLILLAYKFEEQIITLTLLQFGPHENFYRDLKKQSA